MVASRELSPSASGPKSASLPSEVLAKAADLIAPEGAWTQETFWRLPDGTTQEEAHLYGIEAPAPSCFCLFGAIAAANGEVEDPEMHVVEPYLPFLFRAVELRSASAFALSNWNDKHSRTQAEVVTALRKASELAKAEGQ